MLAEPVRIAVVSSANATSLRPLMHEIHEGRIPNAQLSLIIVPHAQAPILDVARAHGIPTHVLQNGRGSKRADRERELIDVLAKHPSDWAYLSGSDVIIPKGVLEAMHGKVINVHPSLLPRHAGLYDRAVHESVLRSADTHTGCTIHIAEAKLDSGDILLQPTTPITRDGPNPDTVETIRPRVQELEKQALIDFTRAIAEGRVHTQPKPDGTTHAWITPHNP